MESVLEDSISFQLLKQSAISGSAWTSMEYGLYCWSVSVSSLRYSCSTEATIDEIGRCADILHISVRVLYFASTAS